MKKLKKSKVILRIIGWKKYELVELISKDSIEYEKKNDSIINNIILPSKKRKTLDFVLEINMKDKEGSFFMNIIIKQKDTILDKKNKTIKQKDETIEEKNKIIK